jgi:putative transposase
VKNKTKEPKLTREEGCVLEVLPNKEQIIQFQKTFGCARFVYNHFLDMRINLYKYTNTSMNYNEMSFVLTNYVKKEFSFLKEVDKFALEGSLRNLDYAYNRFFENVKMRRKPYGFPKFKSKRKSKKSYTTKFTNNNIQLNLEEKKIKLPKVGWMSYNGKVQLIGKILNATITQHPNGVYTVSLTFQEQLQAPLEMKKKYSVDELKQLLSENQVIAGDLGISTYLTCSNSVKVENPKTLERYLKHLSKLQRRLSKKKYGSKNYHVLSHQIVKLHAKIANARKDFLHKLSHALTANYQMIILEDLNVKGMIKNRKLARHIQDASWGMFKTFVEYKALWRGKTVIFVDRWFPSSKTCSHCHKTNKMLTLSDRVWVCPNCKTEHDRDQNASENLLFEGLRMALL